MLCPRCHQQVPEAAECAHCGVVFSKLRPRSAEPRPPPAASAAPAPRPAPARAAGASAPVRLKLGRRVALFGQLGRMLEAGLPLTEALRVAARGSPAALADGLDAVRARVEAGAGLHEAADAAPGLFPGGSQALLQAGETTGGLPAAFRALAAEAEAALDLRRQVWRGAIYPFVLFSLVFFVPRAHLLITSGLGGYLKACALPYLAALVALAVVVWGVPWLLGLLLGPRRVARMVRLLPGLRGLLRLRGEVRLCRELGAALEAGLGMPEALRLAFHASGEPRLEDRLEGVQRAVAQGASLHEAFTRLGLLDADLLLAVAGGERAGRLVEALAEQGRLRQATLSHRLNVAVQLLSVSVLLLTYLFVAGKVVGEFEDVLGGASKQMDQVLKELGVDPGGGGGGDLQKLLQGGQGAQGADLEGLLQGLQPGQGGLSPEALKGLEPLLQHARDPAGLDMFPEDVREDLK
ncbi:MAG TPA: type II secretion system F family protein [Myxococcota bacterium]|nr:type II secretion system F family protein [Myxococcota bacterium]HRY95179.1 type II secretion system F family protein [Myxococcota bacterium]HSA23394.1 type II secretion system F family protein [Myxococcota bacterium]